MEHFTEVLQVLLDNKLLANQLKRLHGKNNSPLRVDFHISVLRTRLILKKEAMSAVNKPLDPKTSIFFLRLLIAPLCGETKKVGIGE